MVQFQELLPGLPEDMSLECLTRLESTTHPIATRVCKRWRDLLLSREFYNHRKHTGHTHKAACFVQALPKSVSTYGLTLFDPITNAWSRIYPVPEYPNGLPFFCRICSSHGKLVVMGGWDPSTYSPVNHVFVYDFTTQSWTQGENMPDNRSFFAAGELNGQVLIAGGHDESKNALDSAWAYDVSEDEWTRLPPMSQERDECECVVIGSEFWVVGGYRTESQGRFEESAESYVMERGEWTRVEEAVWKHINKKDKKKFGLSESDWDLGSGVQVGACRVQLGDSTIVSGTACQGRGSQQEFYLFEGQTGKFKKLDVPAEFRHYIQSGCFVEL